MEPNQTNQRLSRISTQWTLIQQAHAGPAGEVADAQRRLMQRYCGAAYRYLLGAVRDEDTAMDLFQEFALRFVRGDFLRAAPELGRFRDYVKTALRHLVTDHHRQRQSQPQPLPSDLAAPAAAADDDSFLTNWREELLGKTWEALAEVQPALNAVLRAHADRPHATAAELADDLAARQGRPATAGNVRVMLHRARGRFAELLVAEVAQSIGTHTDAELVEELRVLGLLKLCGPALGPRSSGLKAAEPG